MQGITRPRLQDISAKSFKLKGLLGEEEERKWLFLVTVVVHILLPGIIILKLFQGSTALTKKTKQKNTPIKKEKKNPDLNALSDTTAFA